MNRKKLTDLEYKVTQCDFTEPAFNNKYWDNKEDGIYVDIVSGEVLFSSIDKFDSGTGWPSFTKPIEDKNLQYKEDSKLGCMRTEVRSSAANSHLGHVFNDGPNGEKRYCINSASLDFIPINEMEEKGYADYIYLFEKLPKYQYAILAGGCFWGLEELFRKLKGVVYTQVGYTGGDLENPTYEKLKESNHAEAVKIMFNKEIISYEYILEYFFKIHDPTVINRQGNDIGTQYRSEIFYLNDEQKEAANKIKEEVNKLGFWKKEIVTKITKFEKFWIAEDYHQKYLIKNPNGYTCHYERKFNF